MSTALAELAPLILAGSGYSLEVSPDAEAQKAELIRHSALIVEVTDNTASEAARNQVKALAAMRNLTEKSRKAVKDPVLKIGKDIDAKAAAFLLEIEAEEKRLSGLIGSHAAKVEAERQAELRRQQEAERARIAEEQRLAREAAEKEQARIAAEQEAARKAAEAAAAAEAARKAAEAALFADDATDETEAAAKAAVQAVEAEQARIAAEQEAARQAAEAERQRIAAEQAEAARLAAEERAASFAALPAEKVAGVKFEPDFEVLDAAALYAAFPTLVKLEVKRAETIAQIKSYMDRNNGELPTVPGLAITKKAVVSKR